MCFLKSIEKHQNFQFEYQNLGLNAQNLKKDCQAIFPFNGIYFPEHFVLSQNILNNKQFYLNQKINEAFIRIQRNAHQIAYMSEKLLQCEKKMQKIYEKLTQNDETQNLKEFASKPTRYSFEDQEPEELEFQSFQSQKKLTNILFGNMSYKYKLQLTEQFPNVIYRERNLRLGVKLISCEGQILQNDNVINLYISFCDNKGKWIANNRVGDPMFKGKTSTELCSGQAEFNKIYPQDISRTFLDGQLNIVVYAKPLTVVYNHTSSRASQKCFVDPEMIEPLVIENIVIKAKKRAE